MSVIADGVLSLVSKGEIVMRTITALAAGSLIATTNWNSTGRN
ncbi:MAG TPA: hypothetical protein VG754_12330 [Verrucomicrobiae bacterium]|nr:hypothetical protein [Verrucomicrobiae bacterium]